MSEANSQNKGKRSGASQLLLLMAVFGLPVIGAWFLYFNPGFLPGERSNFGELVQPVHPMPDLPFSTLDGATFSRENLDGYWTLVYSAGASCEESCRKRIYDMRQIRKAMAEHHGDVRRVVVFSALSPSITDSPDLTFSEFMSEFDRTSVIIGDASAVAPLREQFIPAGEASIGHLYLVDPMGNLMMHYLPGQPASEILSDMELLLKVNKWGGGH